MPKDGEEFHTKVDQMIEETDSSQIALENPYYLLTVLLPVQKLLKLEKKND